MSADVPAIPGPGEEQQRALYGESWADRLGRLMVAYRLSQARLAGVIGLSAPMLSQLVTGHRVKISNPAVFGRIVRLEELKADPRVTSADPASIAAVLEEVAASSPVLTTMTARVAGPRQQPGAAKDAGGDLRRHLATLAEPAQLAAAAAAAEAAGATALAEVLREAAG